MYGYSWSRVGPIGLPGQPWLVNHHSLSKWLRQPQSRAEGTPTDLEAYLNLASLDRNKSLDPDVERTLAQSLLMHAGHWAAC